MGVASEHAADLCEALVDAGYTQATVIGEVQVPAAGSQIQLVLD